MKTKLKLYRNTKKKKKIHGNKTLKKCMLGLFFRDITKILLLGWVKDIIIKRFWSNVNMKLKNIK